MGWRVFVVPALLCALAGAPAAEAKPVCHLLTDRRADATQLYVAPEGIAPNDAALDITSADIASNGKQVTTALRLTDLTGSFPTTGSYAWYVYFSIDGQEFFTEATVGPAATSAFSVGYVGAQGIRTPLANPAARGTLSEREIRVSFAAAQLTELKPFRKGTRMTGLRALTARSAGPVVLQADEATGGKAYHDGTPSCVKPGA